MSTAIFGQTKPDVQQNVMQTVEHLKNFQVIEFRRYVVKQGEREHFASYFESFFPEAFEQLGAVAGGSFYERNNPLGFTWVRAFPTLDDRAKVNSAFYYGPVWKEHKKLVNGLMTDSDNVLLLRPLTPERSITILPAVDPVTEAGGAHGIVVAEVFSVKAGDVDTFAQQAEPIFAKYRELGAREAGVLVTLDVPNNFPQLPIRTDGPYLVWFGILENEKSLQSFNPIAEEASSKLLGGDLLRTKPEIVVLDPTHRSRLRWLATEQK
jgi:hypothetical protein